MANQWFKFYGTDYLNSPTITRLTAPQRSCWLTLLCLASTRNNHIEFLNEDTLRLQSGVRVGTKEWEETADILDTFKKFKMIQVVDEVITLINFNKRQEVALTNYERVKKWRAKKKDDNDDDNGLKQNDNARIEENRIEENRINTHTATKVAEISKSVAISKPKEEAEQLVKEDPKLNKLIESFKEVNPTYQRLFANRTQRAALERLIKAWGYEETLNAILVLPQVIILPYAPKITTPLELERDAGKLKAFFAQRRSAGVNKNETKFSFS